MLTNKDLKITIRCPEDKISQAVAAIRDFIRHKKKPDDDTSDGWIITFNDGTCTHVKLTRAGNYSVVAWEADEKGRRV